MCIYSRLIKKIDKMKIKDISFNTMKKLRIYMSLDKNYIWIVKKTYGDKNTIISEYEVNTNETPKYSVYNKSRDIMVSDVKIEKMQVYDLGSSIYISIDGEIMIYNKIQKANHDFERFIATLR